MKKYNIAVVGATGVVGRMMIKVLEERQLPIENLYLFASSRSKGTKLTFNGKEYEVEELTHTCFDGKNIDIALFSAGGETSRIFAPSAAKAGATVIDNSSYWRMDKDVPLIVPEVNFESIKDCRKGIIANPNCSTIQAMLVLKPLMDRYGIKRVIYSTYQSVSGAGLKGLNDLKNGTSEKFIYPITNNCIPHIDVFLDNGYTKEEQKMIDETRKILSKPDMRVTATTVRVPVFYAHSESINIELEKEFEIEDVKELLKNSEGVVLQDDVENNVYPMPLYAADHDEVFVGRIRRDFTVENGINLFCVADNLRKGAATNAVQIAQKIIETNNK